MSLLEGLFLLVVLICLLCVSGGIVWVMEQVTDSKCEDWLSESNGKARR